MGINSGCSSSLARPCTIFRICFGKDQPHPRGMPQSSPFARAPNLNVRLQACASSTACEDPQGMAGPAMHRSAASAACAWLEHRHAFVARWPSNGRQGTAACHLFLFQDPDASANDKFVALELLKNANVAAGMVLPSCQDTGTAIIMGKRGQQVHRNKSAAQPSHAAATRDRRCELAAE